MMMIMIMIKEQFQINGLNWKQNARGAQIKKEEKRRKKYFITAEFKLRYYNKCNLLLDMRSIGMINVGSLYTKHPYEMWPQYIMTTTNHAYAYHQTDVEATNLDSADWPKRTDEYL